MINVNFYNQSYFVYKFNREPKEWTIENTHNLYRKSLDRHFRIQSQISNLLGTIISSVKINDKYKTYNVYSENRDGRLFKYTIRYDNHIKDYIVKSSYFNNSRNDRLELLLMTDKSFELGTEYSRLLSIDASYHLIVKDFLEKLVNLKLRDKYRNFPKKDIPEVMEVDIDGYKYIVRYNESHYNSDFHIIGEITNNEKIKL